FLCVASCAAALVPLHAFASIVLIAASVTTTEGSQFDGVVATFSSKDPSSAANLSATVDWGDGTVDAGSIGNSQPGTYAVHGTHTYVEEGIQAMKIYLRAINSTAVTSNVSNTATVLEAPLSGIGTTFPASPNKAFSAVVATFQDGNPFAFPSDFIAIIHWGDGMSSAGMVRKDTVCRSFVVSGSHTYSKIVSKTVTVDIGESPSNKIVVT